MGKIAGKVVRRTFIAAFLLSLQVAWLFVVYQSLLEYASWINFFFTLISFSLAISIVRKDCNPSYTISWVLLIGFLPFFGGLMYLVFGDKRPSKEMRKRMEEQQSMHKIEAEQSESEVRDINALMSERKQSTSAYIRHFGGCPPWKNTAAKYYALGDDMFAAVVEDLKKAKKFIFIEFYIVSEGKLWQNIYDILKQKAHDGLDVRFVYDDVGSIQALPDNFVDDLRTNGIKCFPFNPVSPFLSMVINHRDHRKIIVIDGIIAYNGGSNLADEYINQKMRFGHWKDTGVRLEGAAVWNFTVMFLNLWNSFCRTENCYDLFRPDAELIKTIQTDGVVQPYFDSPLDDEELAENVYLDIIGQAKKYLYIFTPYLIIGHGMLNALCLAAKRGVDVRIVTPDIPDKKLVFRLTRSYYPPLLKAGVKIYQYTPGFIHAKSYVCDDNMAVVGTINMDYRSLYLQFECGTLLMYNSQIKEIKKDALAIFEKSRVITMEDCHDTVTGSLIDDLLRAASPMM